MSPAAAALLRALVARAAVARDRILLTEIRSTDWQSLTFVGERHRFALRITEPQSKEAADRVRHGLEDAEFDIPGHIVADVAVIGEPTPAPDGSMSLIVEALTIEE
jgi:hypothetical protein